MKVGDVVNRNSDKKEFAILFIGEDSVVVENMETKKHTLYWMKSFKQTFVKKN